MEIARITIRYVPFAVLRVDTTLPPQEGGAGTSDHAELDSLAWEDAGHTGDAHGVAAFDADGDAVVLPTGETGRASLAAADAAAGRTAIGAEVAGAAAAAVGAIPSDGAANVASLRTLGTGAQQAAAGDDERLSNPRTPTAHAASHATGQSDALTPVAIGAEVAGAAAAAVTAHEEAADPHPQYATQAEAEAAAAVVAAAAVAAIPSGAAAGTPSLRALGTGATEAAAGNDTRLLSKWASISLLLGVQQTWTNLPAASTELLSGVLYRPILDLTRFSEIALYVRRGSGVAVAGMVFDLEYTSDLTGATGWTAVGMALATPAASTLYNSLGSPTTLPAGAKGIRLWRAVASGGDGVLDPTIFSVIIYVR